MSAYWKFPASLRGVSRAAVLCAASALASAPPAAFYVLTVIDSYGDDMSTRLDGFRIGLGGG
jgi:hypothetical protein